jgi:DNA-binding response OmpR family regulator
MSNLLEVDEHLVIDLACPEMWLRGKRVDLTRKEWELLCYLARNRGRAITFAELRERAWSDNSHRRMARSSIKQYVRRLRRKLGDDPHSPRYILTKWGFGYRFTEPAGPGELGMAQGAGGGI